MKKRVKFWRQLEKSKYVIGCFLFFLLDWYFFIWPNEKSNKYSLMDGNFFNSGGIIISDAVTVVIVFLIIEEGKKYVECKFKIQQLEEIDINKRAFNDYVLLVYEELSSMIFECIMNNSNAKLEFNEKWINHFAKKFNETSRTCPIEVAAILINSIIKNPIIRCKRPNYEFDFSEDSFDESSFDEYDFSIKLASKVATTFLNKYKKHLEISEIDTKQMEELLNKRNNHTTKTILEYCCKRK